VLKVIDDMKKIKSLSHEILKADHEYKEKIKSLTKEDIKLLEGFRDSMKTVIFTLDLFKAAFLVMLKN